MTETVEHVPMKRLKLLEKRQRYGSRGGRSTSPAKVAAARENMRKARAKMNAKKFGYGAR